MTIGPDHRHFTKWTGARLIRLAYLAGRGLTAREIADDPEIRSTARAVLTQAARFGLPVSMEKAARRLDVPLPPEVWAAFADAAPPRKCSAADLMRQILCVCGQEPTLIRNIIEVE